MRSTFTRVIAIAVICFLAAFSSKALPGNSNIPFSSTPTLNSGTALSIGVNYKSANVSVGTSAYFDYIIFPALPGSLVSFNGMLSGKNALLSWATNIEFNNSHFEIERSFDGKNFMQVGISLGGFADGTQNNYAFHDLNITAQGKAVVYYRVKQVNTEGKFSYSNIIAIRLLTADTQITVSPNPFTSNINVSVNAATAGKTVIRIVDMTGKTIITQSVEVVAGANQISVGNLGGLLAGTYNVNMKMSGQLPASKNIIK